ncbi:carbohydrate ABC transporter permease [Deinococcus yavapaiensis]|uniref:Multiple sugar transport system permease protein n=1 Tax=Deinococcus yavapaiensis KR-236 TaxID=694435 RepID=A0A318S7Z8_9DEIO|nr:carbohydrate ABC transporter permease [Deinococcus yavapaiensis]PYE51901.1 multiple sugar transport system permease protein [Deinococcus yavapaiensis KR-236]
MSIATNTPQDFSQRRLDDRWVERRRWARAGWVYFFLLVLSFLFIGPFFMGTISSFKDNANEYPPRVIIPQLTPSFIATAARLGREGGGGAWDGGVTPGANVTFSFKIRQPQGAPQTPPQIAVPARRPGGGLGAVRPVALANEYVKVAGPTVVSREGDVVTYRAVVTYPPLTKVTGERIVGTIPETQNSPNLQVRLAGGQLVDVTLDTPEAQGVQYTLGSARDQAVELVRANGKYYLRGPLIQRTPFDINIERGQEFVSSDLPPADIQNFGRSLSVRNITPGVMGYTFNNYRRVFQENVSERTGSSLVLTWIGNSFLYAFVRVIVAIIFASLAGYALARFSFPGKELLFVVVLFVQMVPIQVTFISNYVILRDLRLLNIAGLVLTTGIAAGAVFLMKQFFEGLPKELEEAAAIDGASPFQTFWRIMLPQAGPALGALSITTFQGAWNDFFLPLVVLKGNESLTLPIGLLSFRQFYGGAGGDYGALLAGAIISAIPVIVLFIVFQRFFVESQAGSAVKG